MLAALNKEAEKRCKEVWIKEVLEAHGENFAEIDERRELLPKIFSSTGIKAVASEGKPRHSNGEIQRKKG